MLIDLRDRVVVVSGAAQGIGRAIAERFLEEGCRVFGLDLRFRDALPEGVTAIVADVTDQASCGRRSPRWSRRPAGSTCS